MRLVQCTEPGGLLLISEWGSGGGGVSYHVTPQGHYSSTFAFLNKEG